MEYQENAKMQEMWEWFNDTVKEEVRQLLGKIECDECGQVLPAVFDEGRIKIDMEHICLDKTKVESVTKKIFSIVDAINADYREKRGIK